MAIRPGQLAFMPPQLAARRLLERAQPTMPTAQVQRRSYPTYGPGPKAGQPFPPYMDAAQLAATAAQARTPTRMTMPLEMAAMRAPQMRGMPAAPAPAAPTFGQRVGTALRQPLTSPTGMGLATAALTGLEMSGPQPVPTSTGQILARAGMAGLQAYASGKEAEDARAVAERKEQREIAAANKPKFQVVGDRLFKIMPDGRYEDITGDEGPKAPKIKSEGDRYYYDDRVIKTLIAEDGSVYEAGNIQAGPLDMKKATLVDPFTTMDMQGVQKYKEEKIRAPQKTLQIIDRLASQIEKGPSGFVERTRASISAKLKRLTQENPEYTEEELALALQQGTLTQLVGASRLELFGPGVMTEFEQAMAREILAGNFDQLTVEEAVNRLYQFRESFLPNYLDSIEFYNNQPIVRSGKMQVKPTTSGFNWDRYTGGTSAATAAPSANTTPGGNTWSRVN